MVLDIFKKNLRNIWLFHGILRRGGMHTDSQGRDGKHSKFQEFHHSRISVLGAFILGTVPKHYTGIAKRADSTN